MFVLGTWNLLGLFCFIWELALTLELVFILEFFSFLYLSTCSYEYPNIFSVHDE